MVTKVYILCKIEWNLNSILRTKFKYNYFKNKLCKKRKAFIWYCIEGLFCLKTGPKRGFYQKGFDVLLQAEMKIS